MTHAQLVTKVTSILLRESGSTDWWTSSEIGTIVNDVYRELALNIEMCKDRNTTLVTVADQREYTILLPTAAERIISVLDVFYDGTLLSPVSVYILNNSWHDWRDAASGTPEAWFFDLGNENTIISLFREPATADKEIAVEMIVYPKELATGESPLWPFTDGAIIIDGAVSYMLAKPGGGRDLDRADFYWMEMMNKINRLTARSLQPTKVRRLRSIEDVPLRGRLTTNLSSLTLPIEE